MNKVLRSQIQYFQRCLGRRFALGFLFNTFLMLSGFPALCQNTGTTIHGIVTDKAGNAVPFATIEVKDLNTVRQSLLSTDTSGKFKITVPGKEAYILTVSAVGYIPSTVKLTKSDPPEDIPLQVIALSPSTKMLNTVSITAQKRLIQAGNGKIVYNVDKSPAASGSSAYELLQHSPVINVNQEGNLLLKGSSVVNVMIDGKMSYLSGQQLVTFLKGTPSENVTKIEVLNVPGAQFDAAGNNGMINIITRKNTKLGYAANIGAGFGWGRYPQTTEDFAGNIKTERLNIYSSYSYHYNHTALHRTSVYELNNNNPVTYDRTSEDPSILNSNNYKAGLGYQVTKAQQIDVLYNGYHNNWSRDGNGPTVLYNAKGEETAVISNHNITSEPSYSNAFNVNYRNNLDTAGRSITADADYARYQNDSRGYLDNAQFTLSGTQVGTSQSLKISQPSIITIKSIKADLTYPTGSYKLLAGMKFVSVKTDNDFKYDSLANGQYLNASALSNHFIYTETIAAGYLSASRTWRQTDYNVGIRLENTIYDARSLEQSISNKGSYLDFFPFLSLTRQLNSNQKIDLTLSRRINRPPYSELNPGRYYFDKYSYYVGNPYLLPEKAWVGSLTYTLSDKYSAVLTYNRSGNFIGEVARADASANELAISNTNYPHMDRADLMLILPIELSKIWNVNVTSDIIYTAYPLAQSYGVFKTEKWNVGMHLNQTLKLPSNILFEFNASYTSPTLSGSYIIRRNLMVEAGFKKTFFNKALDANIAISDIFHSLHYWGYSITDLAKIHYAHTPDSRRINFSLQYHFGGQLSTGKEHVLDEQKRL